MKNFYCDTVGTGKINIILLSGWGLNSKIWFFTTKKLQFFFKFYLIDLPGFGKNKNLPLMKIEEIVELLKNVVPKKSILLGWSLGGLIASRFALSHPEHTLALITVASSPCFIEKQNWPGINKTILYRFYNDLKNNYYTTINNFLDLQIIGSKKYIEDLIALKKMLFFQSPPSVKALKNGLKIIFSTDLRLEMVSIRVPVFRIYGSLDNLIPKKIVTLLDKKWIKTNSIIIKNSVHAPFLSHSETFCSILIRYISVF